MSIRERLAALNRLQQTTLFKIVASAVVVAAGVALLLWYVLDMPDASSGGPAPAAETAPAPPAPDGATSAATSPETPAEAFDRIVKDIQSRRGDPTGLAVGAASGMLLALGVIWLGLGLTYLGLAIAGLAIAVPLGLVGWEDTARLLLGMLVLAAVFTVLMRLLRLLLSNSVWLVPLVLGAGCVAIAVGAFTGWALEGTGPAFRAAPYLIGAALLAGAFGPLVKLADGFAPSPTCAIARNVLAEAVRLKLSLVFIILLMFMLAALPGLLNADQPLRYRVQSFLQYGTSGSFWLIAMLVILFSCATVCFEQRDKVIWQTMTKPVTAAQYVFGKWLGIAGLSAVLLTVCGAGVYLFTEYLRHQPAINERSAYDLVGEGGFSEDRFILEKQVLTARASVQPDRVDLDEKLFADAVTARIEEGRSADPTFAADPADREKLAAELRKAVELSQRAIEPGFARSFTFRGLAIARQVGEPLVLRYRIDAGTNRPDELYRLTFVFGGNVAMVREAGLGQMHTMSISPQLINEQGELLLTIYNADLQQQSTNPMTLSFPKDGLEVSYVAGQFGVNFVRVFLILFVKLVFLSMLAICMATFLSFPVACLVSFGVFLAAEGAGFLSAALEQYASVDDQGKVVIGKVVVRSVATPIAWVFRTYAELRPTARLVEGLRLPWGDFVFGLGLLLVWTGLLWALATGIFRRRELATYSGH